MKCINIFTVLLLVLFADAKAGFAAVPIPGAHPHLVVRVAERNIAWVDGAWQVSITMASQRRGRCAC